MAYFNSKECCSWSWKKLLKLRDEAKNLLSFKVRNGQDISLWFDDWHPAGRLIDAYGLQIVFDSDIGIDARFSYVLQSGNWVWPPAQFDHLVDIQSRLLVLNWEMLMCLFGNLRVGFTLVLKLGTYLEFILLRSHGGMLYGFHKLLLGMLFCYGLFSEKLLQPKKRCVVRGLLEIHCVDSVMVAKNQLNTSFSNAIFAVGFGGI
jgi:hypothetical protein